MRRAATTQTLVVLTWLLGAGAAAACLPPPPASAAEQAAADLSEQASAWTNATSVYIGRITRIRPLDRSTGLTIPDPQVAFSHEIALAAETLLKGPLPTGAETLTFIVTPWCVPSDIERGQVGDRFVVYAGTEGASARSGMIALARIRHPRTLAAIADLPASAAQDVNPAER